MLNSLLDRIIEKPEYIYQDEMAAFLFGGFDIRHVVSIVKGRRKKNRTHDKPEEC